MKPECMFPVSLAARAQSHSLKMAIVTEAMRRNKCIGNPSFVKYRGGSIQLLMAAVTEPGHSQVVTGAK